MRLLLISKKYVEQKSAFADGLSQNVLPTVQIRCSSSSAFAFLHCKGTALSFAFDIFSFRFASSEYELSFDLSFAFGFSFRTLRALADAFAFFSSWFLSFLWP